MAYHREGEKLRLKVHFKIPDDYLDLNFFNDRGTWTSFCTPRLVSWVTCHLPPISNMYQVTLSTKGRTNEKNPLVFFVASVLNLRP